MCVGSLAGVTYLHYTVLTSFNRSETTVHCCDPPLSVLAMLVPPNVFHVVSALQFIVFKQKVFNASVQTTVGHVLYFQFSEKNTCGLASGLTGADPGEVKWVNFHPPFSEPPSFFSFSYPSNIEIIFDFSDIITKFTPHFKILDPPLAKQYP